MPALVRLRKCIYGLKQAANAWRKHLHDSLVSLGFHACVSDSCVYIKVLSDGSIIQLATHVDDVLIIASSQSLIQWFVDSMSVIYQIKVQNPLTSYLGMNISCDPSAKTLTLNQPAYIQDLADKYASSISSEFPVTPMLPAPPEDPTPLTEAEQCLYMSKIGSLLYLAMHSRPDIQLAVSMCSQYMKAATVGHMGAVNRILSYVVGTPHLGITFHGGQGTTLMATVDSSYGNHPDRRSQYGITLHLGTLDSGTVYSVSRKSKCVSLSSTEAEYIALCEAAKLIAWARQFLQEIQCEQLEPTTVFEDNQSTIRMVCNGNDRGRTKHVDIRYHYVRQLLADGVIDVQYLPTIDMLADILTKPLPSSQYLYLRDKLLGLSGVSTTGIFASGVELERDSGSSISRDLSPPRLRAVD